MPNIRAARYVKDNRLRGHAEAKLATNWIRSSIRQKEKSSPEEILDHSTNRMIRTMNGAFG